MLLGQLLEHLLPGGERSARSPRAALETQRLEQHLGNLRAAVEIDLLAGGQMQLAAQRVDLRARRGRHLAQHLRIEPDAGALHVEERRKERPLETLVEIPLVARLELRAQRLDHGEERGRGPRRVRAGLDGQRSGFGTPPRRRHGLSRDVERQEIASHGLE